MSRYFTEDHEWVDVDGDIGTVGITDYAQEQLGDIVFVEVPEEGKEVTKGDEAAVVESVKAASDVFAPVTGTVDLRATPRSRRILRWSTARRRPAAGSSSSRWPISTN